MRALAHLTRLRPSTVLLKWSTAPFAASTTTRIWCRYQSHKPRTAAEQLIFDDLEDQTENFSSAAKKQVLGDFDSSSKDNLDHQLETSSDALDKLQGPSSIERAALSSLDTLNEFKVPEVVFSGIQPTGVPHLGNYLGALKQWVEIQNTAHPKTKLLFCIVDLHAITMPADPTALRKQKRETLRMLLALGLDPDRCIIFYQSDVPEHTELMWILSCITPNAALTRQTQWKSKIAGIGPTVDKNMGIGTLGLFSYPVLQAADILLYKATKVPVGEDQQQHLELARDLAGRLNRSLNSSIFPLPATLLTKSKRIMSLNEPREKMSKSARHPKSRIDLSDGNAQIHEKIKGAVSDSEMFIEYDPKNRSGISNLIEIYGYVTNRLDFAQIAEEERKTPKKDFKRKVSQAIVEELSGFRRSWEMLKREEDSYFEMVEKQGAAKASELARETMNELKMIMGLAPRRRYP